jgi:hypothetical protein
LSSRLSATSPFYFPKHGREYGRSSPDAQDISDVRTLSDFKDRDSRLGFIRKVYAIFSTQMISTTAVVSFIISSPEAQNYIFKHFKMLSMTSTVGSLGVLLSLVFSPWLRYTQPINFILLGIYTMLQSIVVGIVASAYDSELVGMSAGHTAVALTAITLYSMQPNPQYDLSTIGNTLLASVSCLILGILSGVMFPQISLGRNIISGLSAIIFALYVAHDTQQIVGGTHHKRSYSQKDYILAAMNLYQDVISMFIRILEILGNNRDRHRDNKREHMY